MKVLVVGGGGREHALVWKISQSPVVRKIYCWPGNAGIAQLAECVKGDPEDLDALLTFAARNTIDLTVVGPEAPLTRGIVNRFERYGLKVFGPTREAALIEGSKAFAKSLMKKYGIPTADHAVFEDPQAATGYIRSRGAPIVVKADGLAAGKGVVVAHEESEALEAVKQIMVEGSFGEAGQRVVIEEYLEGEEVSVLAFTDGERVIPMASAQDHKRAFDGDRGPNTGGMGAYSPAPCYTPDIAREVMDRILMPAVEGMRREGRRYVGVLYAGLVLTGEGPKVLEFNARFGDPETQAILPRLKADLLAVMQMCVEGRLDEALLEWSDYAAVCVVLASGGYPGSYEKGKRISGLREAEEMEGVYLFHAGTEKRGDECVTAGGRVLGVTATGKSIKSAIRRAYDAAGRISFENMHYRRDIGRRALER